MSESKGRDQAVGQRPTHPRPQLQRKDWISLDGEWEFAMDREARWYEPDEVVWDRRILVPFAPETKASGIGDTSFYQACWYRKKITIPPRKPGERVLIHFGAVDFRATVWADGACFKNHEGGYTPFTADITPCTGKDEIELVVRAEDDPHDLTMPRGKQDWQLNPHSIWYPRTTGIWQTVWMELVPGTRLDRIVWTPTLERYEIGLEAFFTGAHAAELSLHVVLRAGPVLLADDAYGVLSGEVHRRIALSDPGVEDFRNELLWSPDRPTLIQAWLRLIDGEGQVIDEVWSYTALRSIAVQGNCFILNGRPLQLRLVLDQGYWPDTGQTAPNELALRRDVELAKAMGFNGVRKHQKIEDPRYLYWADTLGLLVWEEMPSAYRFNSRTVDRLVGEWMEVIDRDRSHPCVIAWVPFNESWGVPDLPDNPAHRHFVQSLYHLTKTLDPTRPVVGNDGWESVATDIIGIHDYDNRLDKLAGRYGADEDIPRLFRRERPGGRMLILENAGAHNDHPIVLTEFGGITYSSSENTWGYSRANTLEDFAERFIRLMHVVRQMPVLAGFCYTQFSDTYQEANGLLQADRTPKIPLGIIAHATRGPSSPEEHAVELAWREELMRKQRDPSVVAPPVH